MPTKTGNSYATGDTTDGVEIPTVSPGFLIMATRIKCRQVTATVTDIRIDVLGVNLAIFGSRSLSQSFG